MSKTLPGGMGRNAKWRTALMALAEWLHVGPLIKACQQLVSNDASDLTALICRAIEELSADSGCHEFRHVSSVDKSWVSQEIEAAYDRISRAEPGALAVSAVSSISDLARLAKTQGLDPVSARELRDAGLDVQGYVNALNRVVAGHVRKWYLYNRDGRDAAAAYATFAAVGDMVDAEKNKVTRNCRELSAQLMRTLALKLESVPEYYPSAIKLSQLGSALRVVELDKEGFRRFSSNRLYWDGTLFGRSVEDEYSNLKGLTILLGDPGSGKTTFAKMHALNSITLGRPTVYLRLEDLEKHAERMAGSEGILVMLAACCQSAGLTFSDDYLRKIVAEWSQVEQPVFAVMDGLDEVATPAGYACAKRIVAQAVKEGMDILLTSRLAGYTQRWELASRHWGMIPLETAQQREFATRWFQSEELSEASARFAEVLELDELAGVMGNPLTLGFICLIAQFEHIPRTSASVIDRFLDHFIRGPWRPPDRQISDPQRVVQVRQASIDVAWRMANSRALGRDCWADSTTFQEIVERGADPGSLVIYELGLLIPHGHLVERGDTHQAARWLHRRIHENLVAQRLCSMVVNGEQEWKSILSRAALSPAWAEVIVQFMDLLPEGELVEIGRFFLQKAKGGDVPQGRFSDLAFLAAIKCCSDSLRDETVAMQALEGAWRLVMHFDLRSALEALVAVSGGPMRPARVYEYEILNSPDLCKRRSLVAQLVEVDRRYSVLLPVIGILTSGEQGHFDVLADLICGRSSWLGLPTLPERIWCQLLDCVEYRIEAHSKWNNSLNLWSIEAILGAAAGQREIWPRETSVQPLRIVHAGVASDHMYTYIDYLQCDGFPEIRRMVAWHLIAAGLDPMAFDVDERTCFEECWCGLEVIVGPWISPVSGDLAVEILKASLDPNREWSTSRIESGNWALKVLEKDPRLEAIPVLLRMVFGNARSPLDSNHIMGALNCQDWGAAAQLNFPETRSGEFWRGFCMAMAGLVSLFPYSDREFLDDEDAVEFILSGIRLILNSGGKRRSSVVRHIASFADIPEEYMKTFAEEIVAICQGCVTQSSFVILKALADRLFEMGVLADYPGVADQCWRELRHEEARVSRWS
ncbi:MAG: hypothetical protein Q4D79_10205 [Propionibacteriaceae bacterium]|nr:hypothetical protein [Propionibacteriaceae bacterium]